MLIENHYFIPLFLLLAHVISSVFSSLIIVKKMIMHGYLSMNNEMPLQCWPELPASFNLMVIIPLI